MAYGLRYKAEYTSNGRDIKIEILKDGYTGAVYDVEGVTRQLSLRYKAKDDSVLNGSEFRFTLMTKNNAQYTELLTAQIGDYIGKYYIDNVLQHTGELDVENIETQYFNYVFEYDLSFNDRIPKLDKFRISDEVGDEIEGQKSLLWYIKQALIPTNIELDFAVILNTKEDTLFTLANDNALSECTVDAERFKRVKDGKKEIYNCKEVLEAILKPFNLRLFQAENKYFIVNQLEYNSFQYNYTYATLALASRVALSNTVDISAFQFDKSNRLTKLSALKSADVIFRNKTVNLNLVRNPNFDDSDLYWFKDEPGINVAIQSGELAVSSDTDGKYIYSEDYAIEKITDNDYIRLYFEYYLFDITYVNSFGNRDPELEVSIIYENGDPSTYITPLNTGSNVFDAKYANLGTGNYRIEIRDRAHATSPYTSIQYRMDNFRLNAVSQDDILTYDRFYNVTNTDNKAIDIDNENVLLIADGIQSNDVGNLKVGGTLTTQWSTFGLAESQPLTYIYLLNKLRARQNPNNDLKLTIIDDANTNLNFYTSVLFDTKRYRVKEFSYNYGSVKNIIELELIEVNYSSFNYTKENTTLTSVEGESTENTDNSLNETDPTVPNHVKNITQLQIDDWESKPFDLNETLTNGNTSSNSIILTNGANQFEIKVTAQGNLLFDGGLEKNVQTSGDFNAFSDSTSGTWWDNMPIASATVLGGIKVGSNLTIDSNGVLNAEGGSGSASWGSIGGTLSDQTDLQNALNSKENSFTKNTAFNKNFGTASGTVAQGNDSRILNGQTAFNWGNHSLAGYALNSELSNYVTLAGTQTITGAKTFTGNPIIKNNSNPNWSFRNADGTSGGYVGRITSNNEVRLYNYAGGNGLYLYDNGNSNIGGTGNFGINKTSPSEKLDVDGRIRSSQSIDVFGLSNPSGGASANLAYDTTNDRAVVRSRSWDLGQWKPMRFAASEYNFSVGNVGINTSSPTYKLDVNGTGNFSSTLELGRTNNIRFGLQYSEIKHSEGTDHLVLQGRNGIHLQTYDGNTSTLTSDLFTRYGKVGIGTTSPNYKLDVNGDSNIRGDLFVTGNLSATGTLNFQFKNNIYYNDSENNPRFYLGSSASSNGFIFRAGVTGQNMNWRTSGNSTLGNINLDNGYMRLGNGGSPSEMLDVGGSAIIDADLTVGNNVDVGGNIYLEPTGSIYAGADTRLTEGVNITGSGMSVKAVSNPTNERSIFAVESSGGATRFGVTQTNGGFFRDSLRVGFIHDDGVITNLEPTGTIKATGDIIAYAS